MPRRSLAIIALLSLCELSAASYYVRTDGNDSNDGSANDAAHAWLTIQYSATNASAGDTVYVADGSYGELVQSVNSGSSNTPITFIAESTNTVCYGWNLSHPYVAVDGFSVTGDTVDDYDGVITVRHGADNCSILHCLVQANPSDTYGLLAKYQSGVSGGPQHLLVSNCYFLNGGFHAVCVFGDDITLYGNRFTSSNGWDAIRFFARSSSVLSNQFIGWSNSTTNANHADLIQSFSDNTETSTNVLVANNFAYGCENCQIGELSDDDELGRVAYWTFRNNVFVHVGASLNCYAPHCSFWNNTFAFCTTNSGYCVTINTSVGTAGEADYADLRNNIWFQCGDNPEADSYGFYYIAAGLEGVTTNYNLVCGSGAGTSKTDFTEPNGINGVDPLFRNGSGVLQSGFALLVGSPAINAGADLSSYFTTDITGKTRTGDWDIGAYEYGRLLRTTTLRAGNVTGP